MVTDYQQCGNIFPAAPTLAWQTAYAARRMLSPPRLARIRRVCQAVSGTPRCRPSPAQPVTSMAPPTPHAMAYRWWTPPAVSVCHRDGQHATARHRVSAQGYGVVWGRHPPRTYGRNTRVPTGEITEHNSLVLQGLLAARLLTRRFRRHHT